MSSIVVGATTTRKNLTLLFVWNLQTCKEMNYLRGIKKMRHDYLYDYAIRSVEKRTKKGKFEVVFFSPTKKDFTSLTGLSETEAALMVEMIQARLALQWGAPATMH